MTLPALTPRQLAVLQHVAHGQTDATIAELLHISLTTAQRHVLDVRTKLGANNRAHAVALAFHHGILT